MVEYIDSFMGFKYAIRDDSAYFLTHTVVGWIDIAPASPDVLSYLKR